MKALILVIVALSGAACGSVLSPDDTGESTAVLVQRLPLCDDLDCYFLDQWSYTESGTPVVRRFCHQASDSCVPNELGCRTDSQGTECRFDYD